MSDDICHYLTPLETTFFIGASITLLKRDAAHETGLARRQYRWHTSRTVIKVTLCFRGGQKRR